MTWWKKTLIVLGALLVLFLLLGIFMSKEVDVSITKKLDAPVSYLYNLVNNQKDGPQWNPWIEEDPKMELSFGEKTEGEGSSYSWKSEKMGNGSVTYIKSVLNKEIEADLNYEGMDPSKYSFKFEPVDKDETNITWNMKTSIGFPSNVFSPFFKYMIKKSYKKGLANLEEVAQVRMEDAKYNGYEVKEVLKEKRDFIMNRQIVGTKDIQQFYTKNLGAIFQKVQDAGLTMKGMPCGLFFKYQVNGQTDMAAAIPVSQAKEIKDLSGISLPTQQAAEIDYYGDYNGLTRAHDAIQSYLKDRGMLYNAPIIEEYVTDPIKEKDPAKWLTKVTYFYTKGNG
jgi:effector-binding domain-containing protein